MRSYADERRDRFSDHVLMEENVRARADRRQVLVTLYSGPVCLVRKGSVMQSIRKICGFLADEQGTETLEWGLVCGLIVVGAITAIALIGPKVKTMWTNMNAAIP